MKKVTLPQGLESIGKEAFYYCEFLEDINIPDTVTQIGDMAFGFCGAIEDIYIPSSVTSIGHSVFFSCSQDLVIKAPRGSGIIDEAIKNEIEYIETEE